MQNIIDNLVFPAPKPGYTEKTFPGQLIFIPKFRDYKTAKKNDFKMNEEKPAEGEKENLLLKEKAKSALLSKN